MVCRVGVVLRKRLGHSQSHTVCEDSQKNKDIKRPEQRSQGNRVSFIAFLREASCHSTGKTFSGAVEVTADLRSALNDGLVKSRAYILTG